MLGAGCLEKDQTQGIVRVRKDLEKSTSPTPCNEQGHLQLHQDRMQPLEMPREGCNPWECQEKDTKRGMKSLRIQEEGYQERDEVPRNARKRMPGEGCGPWGCRLTQTCSFLTKGWADEMLTCFLSLSQLFSWCSRE